LNVLMVTRLLPSAHVFLPDRLRPRRRHSAEARS
jgi:hypothetical protein